MNIISDDLRGAKGLISELTQTIESGDEDGLSNILDSIPFEDMKFDDSVNLIIGLLKICDESDEVELAKLIYDKSVLFYPNNTDSQFITHLFFHKRINVNLLYFLLHRVLKTYNLFELIYQFCYLKDKDSTSIKIAIDRCWEIFETPSIEDLNKLYNFALESNVVVAASIALKLRKENDYAPIPTWIISSEVLPLESNVKIPPYQKLELGLPNPENVINTMIAQMDEELKYQLSCSMDEEENDVNISKVRDILLAKYNALSLLDKYEIANDFVSKRNMLALQYDLRLFIILGPSAPLVDSRLDELTPEVDESGGLIPQIDYGGARMFTFNNFDINPLIEDDQFYDDGVPKNIVNWFVGYCMECNLKIKRKYHAVRIPMIYGGWQGCYCNWECVRSYIVDNFERSELDIISRLIDVYEDQLNKYKILDRISDDKYGEYMAELLNKNKVVIENNEIVQFIGEPTNPKSPQENLPEIENEIEGDIDDVIDEVVEPDKVEIGKSPIILHYFYSDKCDICKRLRPQLYQFVEFSSTVDELGNYVSNVSINEINVDETDVTSIGVTQVPTVVMVKDEVPVKTFIGGNIIRPLTLEIAGIKE